MSLTRRLLLTAGIVLVLFLGVTGWVLDRGFTETAEMAQRDRLRGHVYALLAAADVDARRGLVLEGPLPEARFATPGSGLYARIINEEGRVIWRSPSVLGFEIPFSSGAVPAGASELSRISTDAGLGYFQLAFGVDWEQANHGRIHYVVQVAETVDVFRGQVQGFRRSLWGWLAALGVGLLGVQVITLRWGLAPLRRIAGDLERIKAGRAATLTGRYPRELAGLGESINSFIESERTQRDRYRDTLGNLAHSLKTPLAVLRGAVNDARVPQPARAALQDQVDHLNQIVDYQLRRAATSGRPVLGGAVGVEATARRVAASLARVYAERDIQCTIHVSEATVFWGDEGDLLELLGNVLENAYKWARHRVTVTAGPIGAGRELEIAVEDDGPGIPEQRRHAVPDRGVRADAAVEGQGIGLAVVRDIVATYGGSMDLGRSSRFGGARIVLRFPSP